MKFYSTNNPSLKVSLAEAVTQGLAPDNGLYMPESIPVLPATFYDSLHEKSLRDMAFAVSQVFIGDDVPSEELNRIVDHTIQFDAPLVPIEGNIYALELFHGPTLAFKDFGARFMSQLLGYFAKAQEREINVLVATSGDTGSAVANGFLGVPGTKVIVLYPSGKVSEVQEKQFTTLEQNIIALEIDGTFDDCQRLVKQAFLDDTLKKKHFLTSANSINIARLIPQSFYYFYAYAQAQRLAKQPVVFAVPSGNFGNITGGLLAHQMGLPIKHFIAATNTNDAVPTYLASKEFNPQPSKSTISNAMDVGNPSNFARMLDLFQHDHASMANLISGYAFSDSETQEVMRTVFASKGYTMDPHGAIGYLGLKKYLKDSNPNVTGIFLETAHPAKFKDVVEDTLGNTLEMPDKLQQFLKKDKKSVRLDANFDLFKAYLMDTL